MTLVHVEDLNDTDAVVVVIVGDQCFPIVFPFNFCNYAAEDNLVVNGIKWDLREESFHRRECGLGGKSTGT
jgi:hypothetical protein